MERSPRRAARFQQFHSQAVALDWNQEASSHEGADDLREIDLELALSDFELIEHPFFSPRDATGRGQAVPHARADRVEPVSHASCRIVQNDGIAISPRHDSPGDSDSV